LYKFCIQVLWLCVEILYVCLYFALLKTQKKRFCVALFFALFLRCGSFRFFVRLYLRCVYILFL
jgi:uncharacterized membrane protein YiaA